MDSVSVAYKDQFDFCDSNKFRKVSIPKLLKVKRAICFGSCNSATSENFVREELKKQITITSERWNFNFEKEKPLDGIYIWERVASKSPINRMKRKRSPQPESCDNGVLYYNPDDTVYKSNKTSSSADNEGGKLLKRQRLMTDYLPARKRPTMESGKNSNSIQAKKSRLAAS